MKILVINGPNINMLGIREPELYGHQTYGELLKYIKNVAREVGVQVECYQSNHEGDLVDVIQGAYEKVDGIIINPGAYTHTSIAIPDAIRGVGIPTIEVHLTDITTREEYRQRSYTREVCIHSIIGKGFDGYREAIGYLAHIC